MLTPDKLGSYNPSGSVCFWKNSERQHLTYIIVFMCFWQRSNLSLVLQINKIIHLYFVISLWPDPGNIYFLVLEQIFQASLSFSLLFHYWNTGNVCKHFEIIWPGIVLFFWSVSFSMEESFLVYRRFLGRCIKALSFLVGFIGDWDYWNMCFSGQRYVCSW